MSDNATPPSADPNEPPPFLGSWTRVYAALVALLVTYIVVFSVITAAYR